MNTVLDTPSQQVLDAAPPTASLPTVRQAHMPATLDVGALINIAVQRGDSIDVLNRLFDLQQRVSAESAKQQFNRALANFAGEHVSAIRGKLITDGPLKGKKFAELSDVLDAATPVLAKFGLKLTYRDIEDGKDWIKLACVLRHDAGHSEEVAFGGPVDTGPGRNGLQARKSTVAYLRRITALMILGIAEKDEDDDGAGGAPAEGAEVALMQRLIGEAQQTTTDAAAASHWRENSRQLLTWPYAYEKYKQAVAAHRTAMKQAVPA